MNLTKYKLGDLIVQRREKNNNYDVPIRGVSKDGFIPAKQKDADTSIYNVFYKYDFVFNPARMELNSIALNLEYDKALCSSLYEVFYVKDESIVLPEFLNLHIKRDEFTRHCDYIGLGSAREYCRFANIAEFDIELPPIEVQEEIVEADRLIKKRISLNNQMIQHLEATAQVLYRKTFVDNIDKENLPEGWRMGTLGEICIVNPQLKPKNNVEIPFVDMDALPTEGYYIRNIQKRMFSGGMKFVNGDILFARITPCMENGKSAIVSDIPNNEVAFGSTEFIVLRGKKQKLTSLLATIVRTEEFRDYAKSQMKGTDGRQRVDHNALQLFEMILPNDIILKQVELNFTRLYSLAHIISIESTKLTELQSLLLAKMGGINRKEYGN